MKHVFTFIWRNICIVLSCWKSCWDVLFFCLVERFYYMGSKLERNTWDQTFCDLILIFMKTEFQHVLILLLCMLVLVMCLKSEIKISLKLLVAIFLRHNLYNMKQRLWSTFCTGAGKLAHHCGGGVDEICPGSLKALYVVSLSWLSCSNIVWKLRSVPSDRPTMVVVMVPCFMKGV